MSAEPFILYWYGWGVFAISPMCVVIYNENNVLNMAAFVVCNGFPANTWVYTFPISSSRIGESFFLLRLINISYIH